MKRVSWIIALISIFSFWGCSEVEFESLPRCGGESDACVEVMGFATYKGDVSVGMVDILFVDDNSGSMSTEQSKMAQKFPDFKEKLQLDNIDFRIGVITTDVSASPNNKVKKPANGNGAFQDGNFLKSSNGYDILTPETPNLNAEFANIIQRQETLECEANNYKEEFCPSTDERGIYAVNMAIDKKDPRFFREDSPLLAVVILSDEDERGDGDNLEAYDLPETLVEKVANQLGNNKQISVSSLIIKPDLGSFGYNNVNADQACYDQQAAQGNQWVYGEYGTQYARLAKPDSSLKTYGNILDGYLGNICAYSYSDQLKGIANKISTDSFYVQLECKPATQDELPEDFPISEILSVYVQPPAGQTVNNISYEVDSDNRIKFSPSLPAGTKVSYEVVCTRDI